MVIGNGHFQDALEVEFTLLLLRVVAADTMLVDEFSNGWLEGLCDRRLAAARNHNGSDDERADRSSEDS